MYECYINDYKGSAIPNLTAFKGVLNEATAYVDGFVLNTDNLEYEDIKKKYKFAICAVADVIYQAANSDKQKQSESVGNHSVSYRTKSAADYEADKRTKVMTFLYGTGLMYSAM